MRIEEICANAYREERERASAEQLEILDREVIEISLSNELLNLTENAEIFEQDTLVGALRTPRQLGICLKRKFYHIPAVYIEEYAIPKYIALYQSQNMFGDEVAGIKYYGEVKRCTPMRRSKIREIPKKSNELYYVFKIKKWQRLDSTVCAKEIGFVRLFTSSFVLKNVSDVSALTISNAYEFKLYKFLKLAEQEVEDKNTPARFELDGFDVIFTKDVIYLCREGKIIERYWLSSLKSAPSLVLRKIQKDMEAYIGSSIKG